MIIDRIENSELYLNLGKRIARAFNYINSTDFSRTEPGRYEVENEDIFVVVNEYETKDINDSALEAHRKYIDIQYMYSGVELIGVAPLVNQTPVKKYNEEKDCVFFNEETSLIKMTGGMFAIFFPGDLHMPGVKANGLSKVKKIVVKVRI